MKIFTARQIKECDAFTIQREGISGFTLMERAATACCHWICEQYSHRTPVLVICGMGNNGGDGLALARLLLEAGFSVRTIVLRHSSRFSEEASENLKLLHQAIPDQLQVLEEGQFISDLPRDILIVDALLGSGLNRPLEGWLKVFIEAINEMDNEKIAIDIPSGLYADALPEPAVAILKVSHTLSFQFYKRSFLHPEAARFTGQITILDIGLSIQFIRDAHTPYHIIGRDDIAKIYKPRNRFAHKGTYGKAMLVGGSYGKIGAIALSAKAALKTGAGLVFTQAPDCGYTVLQSLVPEAMFIKAGTERVEQVELPEVSAIGIGPGMGTHGHTAAIFQTFMGQAKQPLVIDADALNLLSQQPSLMTHLHRDTILTPHPKEFTRLFGETKDSVIQVEMARAKAMKHNITIVLKGHHTAVLTPEGECWYNMTGNAGMATGGSGDVLTGIITALLAQGYTTKEAAIMGIYIHGSAGDIAAEKGSQESLSAGDIIDALPFVFKKLGQQEDI